MRDSRPTQSRLQLRITSINRQLRLLRKASEDESENFPICGRLQTLDSCRVGALYSTAKRELTGLKNQYQNRLDNGNYFGQPR